MRLGHVKMRIQVCENGKGDITDSRAWALGLYDGGLPS